MARFECALCRKNIEETKTKVDEFFKGLLAEQRIHCPFAQVDNTKQLIKQRVEDLKLNESDEYQQVWQEQKEDTLELVKCQWTVSYTHLTLPTTSRV